LDRPADCRTGRLVAQRDLLRGRPEQQLGSSIFSQVNVSHCKSENLLANSVHSLSNPRKCASKEVSGIEQDADFCTAEYSGIGQNLKMFSTIDTSIRAIRYFSPSSS
jgi:hypothetical protein